MSSDRPSKAERKSEAREKARRMREEAERRQKRNRVLVAVVTVVAVLAVILGVGLIIRQAGDEAGPVAGGPDNVGEAGQIVVGDEAAPVTVSEYLDYQCPACQAFEQANADLLSSLVEEGSVNVAYHPVSILDRFSGGTRFSTRAAAAAMCVADVAPEAFPEFNSAMFANQPPEGEQGLSDEQIVAIATQAGAPESVATCIEGDTYESYVTEVTARASEEGLPGTPWVMVNGEVVENALQPGVLEAAVRDALAEAGVTPGTPSGTTSPTTAGTPTGG